MSGPTIEMLVERLRKAKRVAVFTHQRPDPDALGSQAAAGMILKAPGAEEVFLMQFAAAPAQYEFLLRGGRGGVGVGVGGEWGRGGGYDFGGGYVYVSADGAGGGVFEGGAGEGGGDRSSFVAR